MTKGWGLAALVGVFLSGGLGAQSGEPVLRAHDIRALTFATESSAGGSVLEPALRASVTGGVSEGYGRKSWGERLDGDGLLDAASLSKLVQSHLLASTADPDVSIEVSGPLLLIRAPASVQREVSAFLGWLENEFTRTIEIELIALPAAALREDHATALNRSETEELLGRHPASWVMRQSVRLGVTSRLRGSHREQIAADQDVEVAKKSSIPDPIVQATFEGTEALVSVSPTLAGGYLAQLELRHAMLREPPARIDLSQARVAAIHALHADSTVLAGSALLEEGGALLIGHDASGACVLLLRLLPEAQATTASGPRGSHLLPLAQLRDRQRRRLMPIMLGPTPSGFDGRVDWVEDLEKNQPLLHHDGLELWQQQARDRGAAGFIRMTLLETRLLHQGSEEQAKILRAIASDWNRRLGGAARLDLRLGRMPTKEAVKLLGEGDWKNLADNLKTRASGSCRQGDSLVLVGGRERSYLKDYDVEIAEDSVIADPIMAAIFYGFGLEATCSRRHDGRLAVRAHFLYQAELPSRPAYESGVAPIGPLTLPVVSHLEARPQLALENGRWTLLAQGPLTDTEDSVVALIRARW